MIKLKRVYEPAEPADGYRVLVERLWPRGISKQRAALDAWLKDAAPSPELRAWFGHDPEKWDEFCERYRSELGENPEAVDTLKRIIADRDVAFIYAASDNEHNSAVVLRDYLEREPK